MVKTGLVLCAMLVSTLDAKNIAYIYGDIADNGTLPSGTAAPFHQMLLTDTRDRGCSQFKALVEAEGYTINSHYDQATNLGVSFLAAFDAVIFGLQHPRGG
ncbi:MAG: hypothetical protein ACI9TH_001883 [Kiritimatiellia bacterium]|jgi:hypothetical protein